VFSVIVTLPCYWEFEIKNGLSNTTDPILTATSLRKHPYYSIFYVGIVSLGVNGIIPFLLLVYFTIHIARGIKENSVRLIELTNSRQGENHRNNRNTRNRPSMVVNLISVLFLTFHSLRLAMTIVEFVIQTKKLNNDQYEVGCEYEFWINVFASISDFLLVVNSSVNTVIYKVVFWKYSPTEELHTRVNTPARSNTHRHRIPSNASQMIPLPEITSTNETIMNTRQNSIIVLPCTPTADNTPNENTAPTVIVNNEVSSMRSEPQTFIELSHGSEYEYL